MLNVFIYFFTVNENPTLAVFWPSQYWESLLTDIFHQRSWYPLLYPVVIMENLVEGKRYPSNRGNRIPEKIVKQNTFSFGVNKVWTAAGIRASEVTNESRSSSTTVTLLEATPEKCLGFRRKRTGLLLPLPKSSFQMTAKFAFCCGHLVCRKRAEVQNPSCLRSMWSLNSQCRCLPGNFTALHGSFYWEALCPLCE